MVDPKVTVFVATGAWDTGKTTTLRALSEVSGIRVHDEAHNRVLRRLGVRTHGHAPDEPLSYIDSPEHLCPVCTPGAFAERVLAEQARIEEAALPGEFLERGYLDPLEYMKHHAPRVERVPAAWRPRVHYGAVFLFALLPDVQRSRWGKTIGHREREARRINIALEEAYQAAGHQVVRVPAGTVAERVKRLLAHLQI